MMPEINGITVPFIPITSEPGFQKATNSGSTGFESIFQEELEKVKFSSHALKRLESRNIKLGEDELNKIQSAVNRAEQKGSKDSLVLMDNTAYIVNIPNRTVVTAMSVQDGSDNVFTNIDSVVLA
jgi:flagellar operon protein